MKILIIYNVLYSVKNSIIKFFSINQLTFFNLVKCKKNNYDN